MKLRWTKGRRGGVQGSWTWDHLMFWDLIDDEGSPPDLYPEGVTVGWVKRERRDGEQEVFIAYPNAAGAHTIAFTLAEAKAALVAWYVAQQLEEMQ